MSDNSISTTTSKEIKEDIIIKCLLNEEDDINLWKLRELGLSDGGFCNNALRRRIWPLLVGVAPIIEDDKNKHEFDEEQMFECENGCYPTQLDLDQIDRDVARCSWHLLTGSQRAKRKKLNNANSGVEVLLRKKQKRLGNLIKKVLREGSESNLRYYQGYHDISCIFLTVLGNNIELTTKVLLEISKSHLKDAMGADFTSLTSIMKLCLFPLLGAFDKQIHDHLLESDITEPFFVISWFITWFAHDIRDTALVIRIFDAIICGHPLLPLYLCVAMILHPVNRVELLFAECEFSNVHSILLGLPRNSCTHLPDVSMEKEVDGIVDDASDMAASQAASTISSLSPNLVPFEELISRAIHYMKHIPPSSLPKLARQYRCDTSLATLLQTQGPSIALLQPPPHWLLTPRVTSHWSVQKQMKLQQKGIVQHSTSKAVVYDTTNAFIAAGYPPKKRFRIRIRRRTMMRLLMVLPLFIAVFAFVLRPLLEDYLSKKEQSCSNPDSTDASPQISLEIISDTDEKEQKQVISEEIKTKFESLYLTNDQSSSHCAVEEEEPVEIQNEIPIQIIHHENEKDRKDSEKGTQDLVLYQKKEKEKLNGLQRLFQLIRKDLENDANVVFM